MREYPYKLYASVSLINNKITGWQVGDKEMNHFSSNYGRGEIECKEFIVNNDEEYSGVFNILASEWFKQWKLIDGFSGFEPY